MGISGKITLSLVIVLISFWVLVVSYTIGPLLISGSPIMNKNLNISFVTLALVGISTILSVEWIGIYITHHFVTNNVINHQHTCIMNSKNNNDKYNQHLPLVSIIIPARNEENVIRKTLLNCLQQTYKNIEVIIICHNSYDRTYQESQIVHDTRIRIFDFKTSESGKGVALNYAMDYAKGEYICLLDADGKLEANFIHNTLPLFDRGYAAVQGKISPSNRHYNHLTELLALEGDLFSIPFMTVRSFFHKKTPLGGTGFIIKKDVLIHVGKFSNALIDDFELSFRLYRKGYRIAFAPLSIVYDEKPPFFDVMIRQRTRWVKGHIDLLKHKTTESTDVLGIIYWLYPVFTLCGLLSTCISSIAIVFYIFFGYYPYSYAYMPVMIWLGSNISIFVLQVLLLKREPEIKRFKNVFYAAFLILFSNYWYVVFIKAFFVKSWANTKTIHGFDMPASSQRSQTVHYNPEDIPVDINNETTVYGTRRGAIYVPVSVPRSNKVLQRNEDFNTSSN
ncbi:MAG: glycosyltransferase [Nitrosopumilales archaeon]|nr:glycosyltransferase [Nitrosopumilales archaeon]